MLIVQIVKSKQAVRFQGVRLRVATSKLDPSAFQTLAAGQSLSAEFDLAHLHDLSPGGAYDVELSGALSSSDASSTSLTGSVPYHSNRLRITVDGAAAAQAAASFHLARRTKLQDCTGSQLNVTQTALGHCARIAAAAKRAALTDGKRMTEYFKSDANATRSEVAAVFDKIADECGSTDSGVSEYYCSDPYGGCSGGVLAYTVPARSYMAYCPLYFRELPALTQTCHDQDQATTNLHEMTHLREIKGTEDYGGYGYEFVRGLTAEQNINHADTYTMFANAVALDC